MADDMTDSTDESTKNWFNASRRTFLGASGVAVVGGTLGFTPKTASAADSQTWDVRNWMNENGWSADEAVSELIGRASDGDTILFSAADGGTEYEIGDSHVIEKSITLKGEDGAQITRTSTWYGFKFQGPGLTGDIAPMTDDLSRGDSTVSVDTGAVDFAVGDYVHIRNQEYYSTGADGGVHEYPVQFAEVTGVSDGSIEISNQAYFDYSSENGQVEKVELLEGPVVDGITMVGDDPSAGMFGMRWVKDAVYRDSSVRNYITSAFFFFDSWNVTWENVTVSDARSKDVGKGEGIKVGQSTGIQALSVTHKNCRRGIDFAQGTSEIYVKDPVVEDASLVGIGHHYNSDSYVSGRMQIEGGTVGADGTAIDHVNGQTYVNGTTVKASGSGLGIAGDNFTAENVTIEGVEGGSGYGVYINRAPSNVGVHGKIVDNPGTFENAAVTISPNGDVENLLFDLDIESNNRFYGIGMTDNTYEDIVIRGTLTSSQQNTDNAIYGTYHDAGVVSGLDISVDLKNHGGDGIYFLRGDRIERVRVHDTTLETGGNYGIWFGYDLDEERRVDIDDVTISGSQYDAIYLEAPGTAYIGDVNTDGNIRTGDGLQVADSGYDYTVDAGNSNAVYESLSGTPSGDSSGTPDDGSNPPSSGDGNTTDPGDGNTTNPGSGDGNTSDPGDGNTSNPGDGDTTNPGDGNTTTPPSGNESNPGNGDTTTPPSNGSTPPSDGTTTPPSNGSPPSDGGNDDDSDGCPLT